LNRGLKESNFDQLYAYLKQHEVHANENRMMMERFIQPTNDPLALVSNASNQKYLTQSSESPQSSNQPSIADNFQMDTGSTSTDNLIESLNMQSTVSLTPMKMEILLVPTSNKLMMEMEILCSNKIKFISACSNDSWRWRFCVPTNLDETGRALGEATSCQDSCLIALQNKQNEFEKYKAFNDRTINYDILQTKLNETLGLLAHKDIDIKEGLKTKAYEILVVNKKHDELVKRNLLTKSQFEGQLKEKSKVISDLKVKEEKDTDKMIEMDKQLKFLNKNVYTRNQSIQTIHMLAPKCATYNGRPTFANPRYLKKAQYEKPCLYEIPYDNSDHANRFAPDREET
ncbi:hypothetical protein Tco_1551111, partial [Tanacetum coccineum]